MAGKMDTPSSFYFLDELPDLVTQDSVLLNGLDIELAWDFGIFDSANKHRRFSGPQIAIVPLFRLNSSRHWGSFEAARIYPLPTFPCHPTPLPSAYICLHSVSNLPFTTSICLPWQLALSGNQSPLAFSTLMISRTYPNPDLPLLSCFFQIHSPVVLMYRLGGSLDAWTNLHGCTCLVLVCALTPARQKGPHWLYWLHSLLHSQGLGELSSTKLTVMNWWDKVGQMTCF